METNARETYDIDVHARKTWAFRDTHRVNIVPVDTTSGSSNVNRFAAVGYGLEWGICRLVVVSIIARGIFALKFFMACFLWISTTVRHSTWCPRKLHTGS
jgi:hypothetical protein